MVFSRFFSYHPHINLVLVSSENGALHYLENQSLECLWQEIRIVKSLNYQSWNKTTIRIFEEIFWSCRWIILVFTCILNLKIIFPFIQHSSSYWTTVCILMNCTHNEFSWNVEHHLILENRPAFYNVGS